MTNTPHFANPNGNVNSSNFGKDPRDADRGCHGPVAGVPLRLASDVLAASAEHCCVAPRAQQRGAARYHPQFQADFVATTAFFR